jgi:tricorn protease
MKKVFSIVILAMFLITSVSFSEEARLLRYPNSSKTDITFIHANNVYVVPITGGLARRVTNAPGMEMFPRFSPDGKTIAFSAVYDGNREIYTMPAMGGNAERLTYSMDVGPLPDRMGPDKIIMHWTADGNKILYSSREVSWHSWVRQLFLVGKDGSLPEQIPVPHGGFASLSEDGTKLAYNRIFREFRTWKRYRGGQADDIWIYDLKTKKIENITNNPAQDIIPIWHGNKVYYASDRTGTMNIYSYDLKTKKTKQLTDFDNYDVKWPSKGANDIAFENGGYIYLLNYETEKITKVNIEIDEDFPQLREKYISVKDNISEFDISPAGERGLFVARGDVFTVPAKKGNIRNLTKTCDVHDRSAVWSPDGKWIAYVSDASGETEIWLVSPDGKTKKQLTKNATTYRYNLMWSPDSKKLLCSDKEMKLYYVDVESGDITQIAQSKVWEIRDFNWSPDSKWVVYTDYFDNEFSNVNLYSLASGKSVRVSDEFFNSGYGVFSADGKYLFFVSDRTFRASIGAFEWNFQYKDMSKIYGLTLQETTESPFAFESDEVVIKTDKKDEKKEDKKKDEKSKDLKIDLDGLKDRLFALPVQAGNYYHLKSLANKLYYVKMVKSQKPALYAYDFDKKKESKVGSFTSFEFSADGKKIIFNENGNYYISGVGAKIKPDGKSLNLENMEVLVNKPKEWKQIFDESWRQMRDFFYDPGMHGLDWKANKEKYAALLPYVHTREDLTYVIGEMISELNIGHAYVGGGDVEKTDHIGIGYLGVIYEPDNSGFYKIKRIYKGRNWEEKTRSPLTEPGINVNEGDYLIAIDGKQLSKTYTPWKALVNKDKKYVTITVNSKPSASGAKDYVVKTLANEAGLRYFNWVEDNRKKVDEMSHGQLAYIHVPDMGVGNGLNEFVKYFYPQSRKKGLIIDDRYNGGGNVSPMIIERLRRILLLIGLARNAQVYSTKPDAVMTGPIVCLVNELSASDGDLFPYQFKAAKIGKVIGKRTWGGVTGIRGSMPFLDGGYMYKPEFAHLSADGKWVIEGHGVEPDIIVDNDPAKEWEGIDEQLIKAVEVALEEMKTNTKQQIPDTFPAYPDKSKKK